MRLISLILKILRHSLFGLFIAAVALNFARCSRNASPNVGNIQFESSVPQDQHELLSEDLTKLKTEPLIAPSSAMLEQMGLSDGSPAALFSWVETNVQYILPDGFDKQNTVRVKDTNYTFENPDKFPEVTKPKDPIEDPSPPTSKSTAMVVMSNFGAGLYLAGKPKKTLYSVLINEKEVDITSPAVGVIMIGPGLFAPIAEGIDTRSGASRAFRIDSIFHEIWHNFGSGIEVAFTHDKCPADHKYAGHLACDRAHNGAYQLGAHALQGAYTNCQNCSETELTIIDAIYRDSKSRIVSDELWDMKTEGKK